MQALFDARNDLFMVDKLPPVGLFNTSLHGGTELIVFFDQAQRGILHQMLGICTGMRGNLGKLRQLLGSEINFHDAFRVGIRAAAVNGWGA